MAITAYTRVRAFWGAFDVEVDAPAYGSGQKVSLGPSAASGSGIGIRRAQLVFARSPAAGYSEDTAVMHFDWINYTAGSPDDSWVAADFVTLETAINAWWTVIKAGTNTNCTFREIRWYRVGLGVGVPNPAVRVTTVGVAGTAGGTMLPPQVSISITNKTGSRRHWGRTYLPEVDSVKLVAPGRVQGSWCTSICNATDAMYTTSSAADFLPVVFAPSLGSGLSIESVQVDDVFDVIRSRRWEATTFRAQKP